MKFTFHYGQIIYSVDSAESNAIFDIYIPLWLDYIQLENIPQRFQMKNLHSIMVRLYTLQSGVHFINALHLHSIMVRLYTIYNN